MPHCAQWCLERSVIYGRKETDPARVKMWIDAGYKLIDLGWGYRMYQRELSEVSVVFEPGLGFIPVIRPAKAVVQVDYLHQPLDFVARVQNENPTSHF